MKKSISDYRALARMTMKGHYGVLLLAVIIQVFIQSAANQIFSSLIAGQQSVIMVGIYFLLEIMVSLIILGPIEVGVCGFYVKAVSGDYEVKNIFNPFKNNLSNVIKVNFFMQLKLFLWFVIPWIIGMAVMAGIIMAAAGDWLYNILKELGASASNITNYIAGKTESVQGLETFVAIYCVLMLVSIIFMIPGIIKSFEYAMIPYILGENENIASRDAFNMTKEMMKGNKLRYFGLKLSFIGWMLLGALAFGVGLVLVVPYINTAAAHFYIDAKSQANMVNNNDEGNTFGI